MDVDLSMSTAVISELAGIHAVTSCADMNWTLHNNKQCTVCFQLQQYLHIFRNLAIASGLGLKPRPLPKDRD